MLQNASRVLATVVALSCYRLSQAIEPLYRARPELLLEEASLILPPGTPALWIETALGFVLVWLLESLALRRLKRMEWKEAFEKSLRSYRSLWWLLVLGLDLVPGLPPRPAFGWWLALEGRHWMMTVALLGLVYEKARVLDLRPSSLGLQRLGSMSRRWASAAFLLAALLVILWLTPARRLTQPYDERWGTGDEPRYVRIAASLLHDGDADVANAASLVGRKPRLGEALKHLPAWAVSTAKTGAEALGHLAGSSLKGQARPLGGQVIQGRDGGVYYVYLPGLPLLLTPAMALDAYIDPGRLMLSVLTCMVLSAVMLLSVARLTAPFAGSRAASFAIAAGLGLSIPLYFYHSQLYPEVTAALCVSWMLGAVLNRGGGRWPTAGLVLAGSLLPWLHTKYYPLWAVGLLGYGWTRRSQGDRWRRIGVALSPPLLSVGLQCLFVFHITGSLVPDSLWVLNGYPRSASWWNPGTPAGLYYSFLDRAEGLLVYSPVYLLALPGMVALYRQSRRALWLSLALVVPYLWIAASHDVGGAGGWSPPARYLVPTVPVWALWWASWLGAHERKAFAWGLWLTVLAASFWIAWGMAAERHFPYDREAFLTALPVGPRLALGTVLDSQPPLKRWLYPALLILGLGTIHLGSRWKRPAGSVVCVWLILAGLASALWTEPGEWIPSRRTSGSLRLRPGQAAVQWTRRCPRGSPRLQLDANEGRLRRLSLRSVGVDRDLLVPSRGVAELDLDLRYLIRFSGGGRREELGWIELRLEGGQKPIAVHLSCP